MGHGYIICNARTMPKFHSKSTNWVTSRFLLLFYARTYIHLLSFNIFIIIVITCSIYLDQFTHNILLFFAHTQLSTQDTVKRIFSYITIYIKYKIQRLRFLRNIFVYMLLACVNKNIVLNGCKLIWVYNFFFIFVISKMLKYLFYFCLNATQYNIQKMKCELTWSSLNVYAKRCFKCERSSL